MSTTGTTETTETIFKQRSIEQHGVKYEVSNKYSIRKWLNS